MITNTVPVAVGVAVAGPGGVAVSVGVAGAGGVAVSVGVGGGGGGGNVAVGVEVNGGGGGGNVNVGVGPGTVGDAVATGVFVTTMTVIGGGVVGTMMIGVPVGVGVGVAGDGSRLHVSRIRATPVNSTYCT